MNPADPAFVQGAAGISATVKLPHGVSAGDSLVVAVESNSPEASVHDSLGDIFVQVASTPFGNGQVELWYTTNVRGGADTVTAAHKGAIAFAEYSGVMSIDQTAVRASVASKLTAGPTAPLSNLGDVVIGAGGQSYAAGGYTAGSGFALRAQAEYSYAWCVGLEDKQATSSAAQTMSMLSGASGYYGAVLATFRAGA